MLQELLYGDRKLVDGWDKMMSIYGIRDIAQCFQRFLRYLGTEELCTDGETATEGDLDWLVSIP